MGNHDFRLSVREKLLKEISELPKKKEEAREEHVEADYETRMWTDLYRPKKIGDLVGNSGAID